MHAGARESPWKSGGARRFLLSPPDREPSSGLLRWRRFCIASVLLQPPREVLGWGVYPVCQRGGV
eukprot:8446260-Lingulodinium_polyedra.AAC.1